MSYRINIDSDRKYVILRAPQVFDLSLGFSFWQYTQPDIHNYRKYVFDLAEVKDLRDSGLGWLMMFFKRACYTGVEVKFINASPAILCRLDLLNIDVDDQGKVHKICRH